MVVEKRLILKFMLKKEGGRAWMDSYGSGHGAVSGFFGHDNKPTSFIKCCETFDSLGNHLLLKKDCTSWSLLIEFAF